MVSDSEIWVFDALARPGILDEIRRVLVSAWQANPGVPRSIRSEVEIATSEIAANIVEHAGMGRAVHLRMEVAVLFDEVQVRFIDDGHEVDVDLASVHLPDDMAERGRGLAVARAVLRQLSYQRLTDGNCWTLLSERFKS